MPDFRIADTAPEHPKLRAAGLPAAGLWGLAGAYCMSPVHLTDGWVPDHWVSGWPGGKAAASRLVSVGLWTRETRGGILGYQFHDWFTIQRSAKQIEEERAEARARAKRNRAKSGGTTANVRRTSAERAADDPRTFAEGATKSHDSLIPIPVPLPNGEIWGGSSGTERASAANDAPPRCPDHENWPADQPIPRCGGCRRIRLAAEHHAADQVERDAAVRAHRRALIDSCGDCSEFGMRDMGDLGQIRCTHPDLDADTA